MDRAKIETLNGDLQAMESKLAILRKTIDNEPISASDHLYVSRCFDLLELEVRALREYLRGMSGA